MHALVTGATGMVGNAIVRALLARGDSVRALVRDRTRATTMLPAGVDTAEGDITDAASLGAAVTGVDVVFHAAGMPEQWARDPSIFDRVNVRGTANVLDAALRAGVARVVYTSTMDVFATDASGVLREDKPDPEPKHSVYERSKQAAEREVDRVRASGLDVVVMNPSSVYGPSPVRTGMTEFFARLLEGKAPMVPPGGVSLAYTESVAGAHLAAADRGRNGERYLLADTFVTMRELAEVTVRAAGLKTVPKVAPAWLLKTVAASSAPFGRAFGIKPMVTRDALGFLLWEAKVDASKAIRELGYQPMDLADGVRRTIASLRA